LRLKIFCFGLLLQFCLCTGLVAQANVKLTPDVKGELIDIVPCGSKLVLVSSYGIYDLNLQQTQLIQSLGDREILPPLQTQNPHQRKMYYPVSDSSLIALSNSTLTTELQSSQGIYLKTSQGDTWIVTDSIMMDEGESSFQEFEKFKAFNPESQYYTDGATHENSILLSTVELGVVKITRPKATSEYKIKMYDESSGLLSNHCTTLSIFGKDHYGVGHPEGISIIQYGKARYQSLSTHVTSPIIHLTQDYDDKIWAATAERLFLIYDQGYEPVDIDLQFNEEIRRIVVRPDNCLFVMTNSSIHIIPDNQRKELPRFIENEAGRVNYYCIRNKKYYSNGNLVYCLNRGNNTWEPHPRKRAPQRIIKDEKGHTTLVFDNNKCLKLSDRTATRLSKFTIPDGEDLNNINAIGKNKYYCTGSNLYEGNNQHFKLISEENDQFYKVIETENGNRFAFGAKGIYAIDDTTATPLLASYKNSDFPFSYNQFATKAKLVTFDKQSIKIIDEHTLAPIDINVTPLEILDIKQVENQLWVLTKKSLISLRLPALLEGRMDITHVNPHYKNVDEGQLEMEGKSELLIITKEGITMLDLDEIMSYTEPSMRLAKVESEDGDILRSSKGQYQIHAADLPVQFQFCSDNYWTDNIKYSYHVNHNGKNSSEWKQENLFTFEAKQNGKFTLVAKYKDDIYGSQVTSEPILINVSGYEAESPIELASGPNLTPFIVISLLLLWLIVFCWRKFQY